MPTTSPAVRSRRNAALALALVGLWSLPARAAQPTVQSVSAAQSLRTEAVDALLHGDVDKSRDLLKKAAELAPDAATLKMSGWVGDLDASQDKLRDGRAEQVEKALADAKLLQDNALADYALDAAARGYLAADDKQAYLARPEVIALLELTMRLAAEAEANQEWLKAGRLYQDLSVVDPVNPEWKTKLKDATRRVRMLVVYAPDAYRDAIKPDRANAIKAGKLIRPTTQPATGPATQPADELEDEELPPDSPFRVRWQAMLDGVTLDMVRESIEDADENYFRNLSERDLVVGGLRALRALATTKGLEAEFASLADGATRASFVAGVDDLARTAADPATGERRLVLDSLRSVRDLNARTLKLPEQVLANELVDGALGTLDPFTNVIWPYDLAEFVKQTQGKFTGVGIQISQGEDGFLKVVTPLEDSPAFKAGIKAEDSITRIDGNSCRGITTPEAVKHITGPEGSSVVLTVRSPDDSTRDVTLTRSVIRVDSVKGWTHKQGGGWDFLLDADEKIGYVRLTQFTGDTGRDLGRALDELRQSGARGVVLDLRDNPGGLLTAATEVADRFLEGGTIVSTRSDRQRFGPSIEAKRNDDDVDLPVVVLVNQYSASASEIVSGALKDLKRATVVGERSYGKGSVQMPYPIARNKALLKLTTSHYYLPSGRLLHRDDFSTEWGVEPDVTVAISGEQKRAIDKARLGLEILRGAGEQVDAAAARTAAQGVLDGDPQLTAALLVMRVQLAAGQGA